jgi:hypothetical protein
MSRRKTEFSSHNPVRSNSHLRRSIAATAARLMADDGITDYGAAKRRAARQLGAGDGDPLPGNDEIEAELRAYHALFQDDEQREHLRVLRSTAVELMTLLHDFRPCLTGQVLDGTAGRHSRIELDLFADSSKDVEIFLLSNQIPYDAQELPRRGHDGAETRLRLEWSESEAQLTIYPLMAERHAQRQRARMNAVTELLSPEPCVTSP